MNKSHRVGPESSRSPSPAGIPLIRPNPPQLSRLGAELAAIEASGVLTNYGPVNTRLETEMRDSLFGGVGACLTVCNATIGLMIAMRQVCGPDGLGRIPASRRRYALMPSFTFAATAHAALLERFADEIACIVPYATFGTDIDLERYERLAQRFGVPVVVDAAASLGSIGEDGRQFGAGFPFPIVYSMHATKTFATAEAGMIYCADESVIAGLRTMGNFGFGQYRAATMLGLNSKLSEVGALLAVSKLRDFDYAVSHRDELAELYRAELPDWTFQARLGRRQAHQFMPILLPPAHADRRAAVISKLAGQGIGLGSYFSPHLAEQPFFQASCVIDALPVTERIASSIIAAPLSDFMTPEEVTQVCRALRDECPIEPDLYASLAGAPAPRVGADIHRSAV